MDVRRVRCGARALHRFLQEPRDHARALRSRGRSRRRLRFPVHSARAARLRGDRDRHRSQVARRAASARGRLRTSRSCAATCSTSSGTCSDRSSSRCAWSTRSCISSRKRTWSTCSRRSIAALERGGRFVITYRDLSREALELDRFIPVRSDDTTILTCFLEYEPETVKVHDLSTGRSTASGRTPRASTASSGSRRPGSRKGCARPGSR